MLPGHAPLSSAPLALATLALRVVLLTSTDLDDDSYSNKLLLRANVLPGTVQSREGFGLVTLRSASLTSRSRDLLCPHSHPYWLLLDLS